MTRGVWRNADSSSVRNIDAAAVVALDAPLDVRPALRRSPAIHRVVDEVAALRDVVPPEHVRPGAGSTSGARRHGELLLPPRDRGGRRVVIGGAALEGRLLDRRARRRRVRVAVHRNVRGVVSRGTCQRRERPLESRARVCVVVRSATRERSLLDRGTYGRRVRAENLLRVVLPVQAREGIERAGEPRPRRAVVVRGATRERREHPRALVDRRASAIRRQLLARRIQKRVEQRRERAEDVVHAEGEVRPRDRIVRLGDAEERELRDEVILQLRAHRRVDADRDLRERRHGLAIRRAAPPRCAPGAAERAAPSAEKFGESVARGVWTLSDFHRITVEQLRSGGPVGPAPTGGLNCGLRADSSTRALVARRIPLGRSSRALLQAWPP